MNMRFDLAAYLITAGADVNKWDFYGNTPAVCRDRHEHAAARRASRTCLRTDNTTGYQVAEHAAREGRES